MSTSTIPSPAVDTRSLTPRTGTPVNLGSLLKLTLGFVVAMVDRNFTAQVLRAITKFLHDCEVGATPVRELNLCGHTVIAKLENENTTGSYKSRGASLSVAVAQASHATEMVTASTGNHGAGVNRAAGLFDAPVTIFVPKAIPSAKLERLRGPRTTIRTVKGDFQSAKVAAEAEVQKSGATFIAPYDSYEAVCGQASIGIELAALPSDSFDAVVLPIGGGGLCAGVALALAATRRDVPVYGVCVTSARAAYDGFHSPSRERVGRPTRPSIADGVLVESPGAIPWQVISALVKDIVLVDDDDVAAAMAALHGAGVRAEGAGALPIAAVLTGQIPAKRPVCVISGGNIGDNDFEQILKRSQHSSDAQSSVSSCHACESGEE